MEPPSFDSRAIVQGLDNITKNLSWSPSADANALGRMWRWVSETPMRVEFIGEIVLSCAPMLQSGERKISYPKLTQSLRDLSEQVKRVYPRSPEKGWTVSCINNLKAELILNLLEQKTDEPFLRQPRTIEGRIENGNERLSWLKGFIVRELRLSEKDPFHQKPLDQITPDEWIQYSEYCIDHIFLRFCDGCFYAVDRRMQGSKARLEIPTNLKELNTLVKHWRSKFVSDGLGKSHVDLQGAIPKEIRFLKYLEELNLNQIEHPLPKELDSLRIKRLITTQIPSLSHFSHLSELNLIDATYLPEEIEKRMARGFLSISDSPDLSELPPVLDQMPISIQCHINHLPLLAKIITPESKIKYLSDPPNKHFWRDGGPITLYEFIQPYVQKPTKLG